MTTVGRVSSALVVVAVVTLAVLASAFPDGLQGFVAVIGFVPGAIVYWFWGVRRAVPAQPSLEAA